MTTSEEAIKPVTFQWDGDQMVPFIGAKELCNLQYIVGERYRLSPYDERSDKTHNQFFAVVHEAWHNWPEYHPDQFGSDRALRKFALIRTGHYDQFTTIFGDSKEAARFIARLIEDEGYIESSIVGQVAVIRMAKTQKVLSMPRKPFQIVKQDVFDFLSAIIGVDVTTLSKEARMAA
ncbi:MAG: hypothetical protein GC182_09120 [Rhodopseudomonas sp.]|nr:hypothetical protein [Rhodopseudomonas sp.]